MHAYVAPHRAQPCRSCLKLAVGTFVFLLGSIFAMAQPMYAADIGGGGGGGGGGGAGGAGANNAGSGDGGAGGAGGGAGIAAAVGGQGGGGGGAGGGNSESGNYGSDSTEATNDAGAAGGSGGTGTNSMPPPLSTGFGAGGQGGLPFTAGLQGSAGKGGAGNPYASGLESNNGLDGAGMLGGNLTDPLIIKGGAAGAGGNGGNAGTHASNGRGGDGGAGGAGGNAAMTGGIGAYTLKSIRVEGGQGGAGGDAGTAVSGIADGGRGGDGGNNGNIGGGNATFNGNDTSITLEQSGTMTIRGGQGGSGGRNSANLNGLDNAISGGEGSRGGDAFLSVTNLTTQGGGIGTTNIQVFSGHSIQGMTRAASGEGGNTSLVVTDTLKAIGPVIFDIRRGMSGTGDDSAKAGSVTVDIANLEIASVFTLWKTSDNALTSADSVSFGNVRLMGGAEFVGNANLTFGAVDGYTMNSITARGAQNKLFDMHISYGAGDYIMPGGISFDMSTAREGRTMLLVDNGATLDLSGSLFTADTIKLGTSTGTISYLNNGDKVILIDESGTGSFVSNTMYDTARHVTTSFGLTPYEFTLLNEAGALTATYIAPETYIPTSGDSYKSYFEAGSASAVSVIDGGRLLDRKIIGNAAALAQEGVVGAILETQGSHFRNDTGSHVKVDTFSAALSLFGKRQTTAGTTTFGAFFEYGHGGYDTYHSLVNFGQIRGDGNTNYYGGGLFAHNRFANDLYVEASARVGRVDNDYSVKRRAGASFDTATAYYGAHLGLGRDFAVGCAGRVDIFGKMFWSRVASDTFRTGANERVHFDAVDSYRSRLGAGYTHAFSPMVDGYVNASWEYEFDGKAGGRVNGVTLRNPPELKGSSGYMELGVALKPSQNVVVDMSVFGMVGQQRGIGGNVGVRLAF